MQLLLFPFRSVSGSRIRMVLRACVEPRGKGGALHFLTRLKMRTVALIRYNIIASRILKALLILFAPSSGGKDSCFNMMKCVAEGHEIVALANIQPAEKGPSLSLLLGFRWLQILYQTDELDSFMFQTVGHEGVELFAEAMGLPLYRASTKGISLSRELHYSHSEGDEVEDLFQLLRRVKDELGIEAVSSGAVLSDYQRLRVENV